MDDEHLATAECSESGECIELPKQLRSACLGAVLTPELREASREELGAILTAMECEWDEFIPHAEYDNERYCRTTLARSEAGELILIGWRPGQASPPHDHGGTCEHACAVRVISGEGFERRYQETDAGKLAHASTRTLKAGDVVLNEGTDIHDLGCREGVAEPLITLHLYSPPLTRECITIFKPSDVVTTQNVN